MTQPGPVALITGASSPVGIGAAIARRLAHHGWRLLLVAEGPEASLAGVVAECRAIARDPGKVEGLIADLREASAAEAMVARALDAFGRVDALVNNAGMRLSKPFGSFTATEFDEVVAVNLRAPFLTSQAVLPAMRRQGGGRIVHVASQLASVAAQDRALYGLTKAALIHLTKCMALELAPENILVNAVSPGPTATAPILSGAHDRPGVAEDRLRRVPAGRLGRPEEIAEVVAFLLTTEATFLLGHDIVVDGGYTLH
ncbi:hypothetical protein DFH01_20340 [Falsiroseomonas bella]|uniref:Short-chain dehydrogenase n=1 Tax=Falsiroseomonas bella TaxID=2184016 RepID=A0A317FA01_9PROT|nr:SDR family oxidoreductase [Falsiroseomonas bella]PWS35914.1 hypothetical protein DFH01_20340 [Falsiroseomonas bella]